MATRAKAPAMPDIKEPPAEEPAEEPELPVPTPEEDAEAAAAFWEDEKAKRPVIVKLARIMSGIGEIRPMGRNAHFGYGFIKDTQVSGVTRPRMAKERLMMVPEILEENWVETKTAKGATSWVTKLKVRFTIIDGDSGDEVTGIGFGYGDDAGDKGANKAFTAAQKYFLLKLFQIGGEDDLEDDTRADARAAERMAGGSAVETGVVVQGANITGVARGGVSEKVTNAQIKQIGALYADLELTPDAFVKRFDDYLGIPLSVDEGADTTAQLNKALKALSGDEAGLFISRLVEEKDKGASGPADVPSGEYGD